MKRALLICALALATTAASAPVSALPRLRIRTRDRAKSDKQPNALTRLVIAAKKGKLKEELRELMKSETGQKELVKVLKSTSWRLAASADTAAWAYIITGDPVAAAAVSLGEMPTKLTLRYFYESLWTNVLDARVPSLAKRANLRDGVKVVGWRVLGSLDTFVLAMLGTGGDAKSAGMIAGVEAVTKIGLDFAHEKAWRKVVKRWFPKVDPAALAKPEH
ncbi:MAG: DUF2061 domain-containing protein [Myxococcales bacterium]|nr:DUF2061 domain-containing protein [Myxococcales bacterium]